MINPQSDMRTCEFCGEPELIDIFEMWSFREFQIETCCGDLHQSVCDEMVLDPKFGADLLNRLGVSAMGMGKVRQIVDSNCQLVLDWNLSVCDVTFAHARDFVRIYHRHCPPAAGWRFGASVYNGLDRIGVVMVGRPVARAYDPAKVVEVNRNCVRADLAPGLVWNACSQLYGWAAREAKRRGFETIITYTLIDEPGTSLIAAGWERDGVVKGRSWNTPSRPRKDKMIIVDKVRWIKCLRKAPAVSYVSR